MCFPFTLWFEGWNPTIHLCATAGGAQICPQLCRLGPGPAEPLNTLRFNLGWARGWLNPLERDRESPGGQAGQREERDAQQNPPERQEKRLYLWAAFPGGNFPG